MDASGAGRGGREREGLRRRDCRLQPCAEFSAELAVDPGHGIAAYELAYLQSELGNLDEAQKGYEQVVARFPDFEDALVGLGGVLLQNQKPKEAIPPLEHATQMKPDDEVAWYRLALAERGVGNTEARQKAMARYKVIREQKAKAEPRPALPDEVTHQKVGAGAEP